MTTAIETALTELSANLRRMEQRHQATGYKFDRLYDLIDAAREELATLTEKAGKYDHVQPYLCPECSGFGLVDRRTTDDPLGSEPCPKCNSSPPLNTKVTVEYVAQYGGNCRDCADEDGVCPSSGLPCRGKLKAIQHVLGAVDYGTRHGYLKV